MVRRVTPPTPPQHQHHPQPVAPPTPTVIHTETLPQNPVTGNHTAFPQPIPYGEIQQQNQQAHQAERERVRPKIYKPGPTPKQLTIAGCALTAVVGGGVALMTTQNPEQTAQNALAQIPCVERNDVPPLTTDEYTELKATFLYDAAGDVQTAKEDGGLGPAACKGPAQTGASGIKEQALTYAYGEDLVSLIVEGFPDKEKEGKLNYVVSQITTHNGYQEKTP